MVDQSGKSNTSLIFVGLGGVVLGILIGISVVKMLPDQNMTTNQDSTIKDSKNSIFTSQMATINGKITKIDPESVTVQTVNQTETFKLSKPIFISKPSTLSRQEKPSEDIKIVPLNEFAVLSLKKEGEQYIVTNINLLPPLGSAIPAPANKN